MTVAVKRIQEGRREGVNEGRAGMTGVAFNLNFKRKGVKGGGRALGND